MGHQRTLQITNQTCKTALVQNGRVADNCWTRLRGLTGVRELPKGDGLLIKPCNSIHTHFMSIPIDVLYVDNNDRVIDMDLDMPTWRIGRRRKNAAYVVELPAGTLARTGCGVGDQLQVRY